MCDIEKFQTTNDLTQKLTKLVVQWMVLNCRPFNNITNDEGLLNLLDFCVKTGDKFGRNLDVKNLMPHSETVLQNITNLYENEHKILKDELILIKEVGLNITCDLWTDNFTKSLYVGVAVHYIKDGKLIHKTLGIVEMESERLSGRNIRNEVNKILMDFNCKLSDTVSIVTKRGSYMKSAFEKDNNIFCINHLLRQVLEKAIYSTPKVHALMMGCFNIVKHFKESGLNISFNDTLKNFTPYFYIMRSVQQNWSDIKHILQDKPEICIMSNLNFEHINDIIDVLKPFEEVVRLLEGKNCPTIHQVYPQIRRLKIVTGRINSSDSEFRKVLKENLLHFMDTIIDENIKDFHKIALFLFPPANKLKNFDQNEKDYIHKTCKEMIKRYEENTGSISNNIQELENDNDDAFNDFVQIAINPPASDDKILNEIIRYESQTILYYKEFDPLEWWNSHKREYPLLYKISTFVLAIPASSETSERLFSKALNSISEVGSEVERNPTIVNQIMFLHNNLDLSNKF